MAAFLQIISIHPNHNILAYLGRIVNFMILHSGPKLN